MKNPFHSYSRGPLRHADQDGESYPVLVCALTAVIQPISRREWKTKKGRTAAAHAFKRRLKSWIDEIDFGELDS